MSTKLYGIEVEGGFDGDIDLLKKLTVEELASFLDITEQGEVEDLLGKRITLRVVSKEEIEEANFKGLTYAGHSEEEAKEIMKEHSA